MIEEWKGGMANGWVMRKNSVKNSQMQTKNNLVALNTRADYLNEGREKPLVLPSQLTVKGSQTLSM